MSRDVGDLLELPSDACTCFQVAETSDSPMGAHLELSLQWEGKAGPGSCPGAKRAVILPEVLRAELWPSGQCLSPVVRPWPPRGAAYGTQGRRECPERIAPCPRNGMTTSAIHSD